jgi:carbon starvation protein CstA
MSYLQITEFKVPRNERLFAVFPKSKKGIKTPSASKLAKATGIRMMIFRFSFRIPTTLTEVLVVFRARPDKCRLEPTRFQITSIHYLLIALSFDARIYFRRELLLNSSAILLYVLLCAQQYVESLVHMQQELHLGLNMLIWLQNVYIILWICSRFASNGTHIIPCCQRR